MIGNLSTQIQRISTGRNVLFPLVIFIGMNIFFILSSASPIAKMTAFSNGSLLDMEFNYSPNKAYQVLQAYGAGGRAFYASTFVIIDFFTPILMNLFLAMTISILFRQAFLPDSPLQRFNLLPLIAMIGDYLENLGIVLMIRSYPSRVIALARLAAFSTNVKFVFTIASGVCILAGVVIWLSKRRQGK